MMKVETGGVKIHNRFDIVVRNAETGEVEQRGQAENIVLDRAWERICNFNSYFSNIVFGTGSGAPIASRRTLFNRLGYKPGVTESLVRAYPTSTWTQSISLGTQEYNGSIITEIGISDTTTEINTHAMITDAEGNPLSVEKTSLRIIDLYATVFISIYDVDSGLFFYNDNLRNYLTGASGPGNVLGIGQGSSDDMGFSITGARAVNLSEKTVEVSGRFDVNALNAEVGFLAWDSIGLGCKVPRVGVNAGKQVNGVEIGVGDGAKISFELPQKIIENLAVYVDGVINNDWELNVYGTHIVFSTPIAEPLIVTADYFCRLIPKTIDNVLDTSFKIKFNGSIPTPIVPPMDFSGVPGAQGPIAGNTEYGFYGEVSAANFISGNDLCTAIGLDVGVLQNSDAGWLKFAKDGTQLLLAMKTLMHTVSWNDINAAGAVWGKPIKIGGSAYIVRLLSTVEWDRLMYPVHVDYGEWAQYTNAELNVGVGDGKYCWTSTPSGSGRVYRGRRSVSDSGTGYPSASDASYGFRPVLEFLYTLPSSP